MKEAVTISDDNRRKDSEEMTKTLLDSQKKLAEIMLMSSQIQQQSQASANSNAADDRTSQTRTVFQPISSTLTADDSFAKEIASALKEAIAATDDNRKKNRRNSLAPLLILKTNWLKLWCKIIQQHWKPKTAWHKCWCRITQPTAQQAPTTMPIIFKSILRQHFLRLKKWLAVLSKCNLSSSKEMAKTQTSELSAIITLALKESQQLSTQSIITAIREMQKRKPEISANASG